MESESHRIIPWWKIALAGLLIFIVAAGLFSYTLKLREPWHGSLFSDIHINLTANTLLFSKIWYREGPHKVRFATAALPASVEYSLSERLFNISWSPGYLLPVYMTAVIMGQEPSASLIQSVNLFCHFLTAYLLSLTALFFLIYMRVHLLPAVLISLSPLPLILLSPGNLWYQHITYMVLHALIPFFLLFILLEIIRNHSIHPGRRRIVSLFQAAVFFAGMMITITFCILGLVVFLIRLIREARPRTLWIFIKKSILFWTPALAALALYFGQLTINEGWSKLITRAADRMGSVDVTDFWLSRFWNEHFVQSYGKPGLYVMGGALVLFVLLLGGVFFRSISGKRTDSRIKETVSVISILLLPSLIRLYMFENHSWHHGFTTLKFSFPLAFIPFVAVPALLLIFFNKMIKNSRSRRIAGVCAALIALTSASIFSLAIHRGYDLFFRKESRTEVSRLHESPYRAIGNLVNFEDVVFSPAVEVSNWNKIPLALCMKPIHKIHSLCDIAIRVRKINQDFTVNLLIPNGEEHIERFRILVESAHAKDSFGKWTLYRISKKSFLALKKNPAVRRGWKSYRRERALFRSNLNDLWHACNRSDYGAALEKVETLILFVEKHGTKTYNPRYYLLRMALLERLGKKEKIPDLLEDWNSTSWISTDLPLWGWDSNSWSLNILYSVGITRDILQKEKRQRSSAVFGNLPAALDFVDIDQRDLLFSW